MEMNYLNIFGLQAYKVYASLIHHIRHSGYGECVEIQTASAPNREIVRKSCNKNEATSGNWLEKNATCRKSESQRTASSSVYRNTYITHLNGIYEPPTIPTTLLPQKKKKNWHFANRFSLKYCTCLSFRHKKLQQKADDTQISRIKISYVSLRHTPN